MKGPITAQSRETAAPERVASEASELAVMTSRLAPTAARISKARRQGGAGRQPGQGQGQGQGQVDGAGRAPGAPLLRLAHVEQYGGAVAGAGAGLDRRRRSPGPAPGRR
ncbi:hypothetical protein GCM10022285_09490 [Streptomyces tunisiensis]|uniref:Uncharacterized protein n=1 Tax=Streptomyces tunisiensis TaxID=948699 RepID=A0ABP7XU25_9ACTN